MHNNELCSYLTEIQCEELEVFDMDQLMSLDDQEQDLDCEIPAGLAANSRIWAQLEADLTEEETLA